MMLGLMAYFLLGLVTLLTVCKRGLHPKFRQTAWFLLRGNRGPIVQFRRRIVVPFLWIVFLFGAWPVCWGWVVYHRWHLKREAKRKEKSVFRIRPHHLHDLTTVAEVELVTKVIDPLGAVPDVPFGHLNGAWQNFIQQRPEGAVLYTFEYLWVNFMREMYERKGFVWVTDGDIGPFWLTRDMRVEL